jgi:hypothetical protein
MPIRSIDYRQSKIKGPMHGLRPKSNNASKTSENSFMFSSDINDWHGGKEDKKKRSGKGMVRLDV